MTDVVSPKPSIIIELDDKNDELMVSFLYDKTSKSDISELCELINSVITGSCLIPLIKEIKNDKGLKAYTPAILAKISKSTIVDDGNPPLIRPLHVFSNLANTPPNIQMNNFLGGGDMQEEENE